MKEVTPKEAANLKDALFIDVREKSERDSIYIPKSVHISLKRIASTDLRTHALTPLRTVVVYCASGCRSLDAANILTSQGYKNVYSLKGGIGAWQAEGLPIITTGILKKEELTRYARQISLKELGLEGQAKLLKARVLIIGVGGLGSPAALYLVAAGVGTVGLLDSDKVELDNLHRQILHNTETIGRDKTDSALLTLGRLNPNINIKLHKTRLAKNAAKIFSDYDIVVDGSDNFETRYVVNEACVKLSRPLVHGSILRFQGQVSVFHPKGGGPCYSCVYPEAPPRDIAPTCAEAGVLGVIPGIVGSMQALEVLKLICNIGSPLIGKLLIFDGLTCKMKMLELKKDFKCGVCGKGRG